MEIVASIYLIDRLRVNFFFVFYFLTDWIYLLRVIVLFCFDSLLELVTFRSHFEKEIIAFHHIKKCKQNIKRCDHDNIDTLIEYLRLLLSRTD